MAAMKSDSFILNMRVFRFQNGADRKSQYEARWSVIELEPKESSKDLSAKRKLREISEFEDEA